MICPRCQGRLLRNYGEDYCPNCGSVEDFPVGVGDRGRIWLGFSMMRRCIDNADEGKIRRQKDFGCIQLQGLKK